MRKPAALYSTAIHVLVVLLLLTINVRSPMMMPKLTTKHLYLLAPPHLEKPGGGGQHDPLPATRGKAPKVVAPRVFVAPTIVRNDHPKLAITPALLELPETNIDASQFGDPLGKTGIPSGGPGRFGGFGDGDHGGIGSGSGPRQGTTIRAVGPKITRQPQLIYKEEPEYSDEARKAHWEGTVVLAVEVDAAGSPINIRVIHSLGLGLDEKAIAAVARWKFRPAVAGNRPVPAPATIEVSFHLL
jgi:TonB family protein